MSGLNGVVGIAHILAFFFYDTKCLGDGWHFGWWIFLIWLLFIMIILVCCIACCMLIVGADVNKLKEGLVGGGVAGAQSEETETDEKRDNMDTTSA